MILLLLEQKNLNKKENIFFEIQINHINTDRTGCIIGITKNKVNPIYTSDIAVGMTGNKFNTN